MKKREDDRLSVRNLIITIVVVLFFAAIIFMYYSMLHNEKRGNIIREGEISAGQSAQQLDRYLSTNIDSIKLSAYTLDGMLQEGRSDEEIQDFLVGQSTAIKKAVNEDSTGLYGYINGRFFSGTNWEPPADYVATERPWYTRAMEHPGEITLLDPYVDVQSGNIMLALGKTLCDGVSVVSVDVSLDAVQELTENAVRSGYSDMEMILNDRGVVVAHSDPSENGKNYNEEEGTIGAAVIQKLNETDEDYFEFRSGKAHYVAYVADIRNGWCCVSVKDASGVFSSLNTFFVITIGIVFVVAAIISIIMLRSHRYRNMSASAMAASEAKSAFLSNMSHEIRTPINAMLGMNEMILRESDDRTVITYSENIKTAGKNLLGLVNDILDFSRIEAGKIEIIPVEYDLSSMIIDLLNMIDSRADEKGLVLKPEIDKDIPKSLMGDEIRLKQIITNLLTNAVKYTEKGTVSFTLGYERIAGEDDSVLLKVCVSDTGIGIKEEDMSKLFLEFQRIEDRNRNIEGTGLGMSITRSLLALMGSELKVESSYGVGSSFSFGVKQKVVDWDPIGDYGASYRDHIEAKGRYRESFTASAARILVVDDNPMNLMVFKSLVKQTGVQTDTGGSGDEGIELSKKTKYDMIFLDHMMPEKDGIETLHEIRSSGENPNAATPTICLTANAISGAREKYIEAGFDDYLTKPIDPDVLEVMMLDYLPKDKVRIREAAENKAEETAVEDPETAGLLEGLGDCGIDTETGIRNSGSLDSYISLLKIFRESMADKKEELNRFYGEGDLGNYTIRIHALKSSLRIIGAAAAGEEAQKLENAGKAGDKDYIGSHHMGFMEVYGRMEEPVSAVLSRYASDAGRPEADPDFMEAVFEEIRSAAEEMDCEMLDGIFEEMREYRITSERKDVYEKIVAAAERYEYGTIIALLDEEGI